MFYCGLFVIALVNMSCCN